ncbi:amidohydrolase family protein [Ferruginibacter yonginensis]|uniref:Amidohydrolase family protein n=1 Tax=Ferruginibacter yonginensis TaxID=1310416 RepID=A0ABV8QWZ8_9BACT
MKKILFILLTSIASNAIAQDNISPAPANKGITIIKNGTIHTGTGTVLANTSIQVNNGKIEKIGNDINLNTTGATIFDATGMQVYPGFILSNTNIGLREIANQVKASNDYNELGELNPNIKSIVAYNTESKIINTLRSNGILFANVTPRGSLIAGTSSVVQFDAWNWEDAVYLKDNAQHFYMPSLLSRPGRNNVDPNFDPIKAARDRIENVKQFFRLAKAYNASNNNGVTNLKFEAVKGLFDKSQKLFIHCNVVKEMLTAIDFVKEFGFDVTLVGASESWQIAPLLKQNNISVILEEMHSLPTSVDDDIDQPFKTPAILQKAGVLFAITDEHAESTGRNLMFNAGTAAAYGLTKEEALAAITLNAAKILGVANKSGSIEVGKDANIIISTGDVLDMRTSVITKAYINGRDINLDDKHKQLNKKYSDKYSIK